MVLKLLTPHLFSIALVALLTQGCRRDKIRVHVPPQATQPHAFVDVRVRHFVVPTRDREETIRVDGKIVAGPVSPLFDGYATTVVVHPRPAILDWDTRYFGARHYSSRTAQGGVVSHHVRTVVAACDLAIHLAPAAGERYSVLYDFMGPRSCVVHCGVRRADGQVQPCPPPSVSGP